MNPNDLRKGFLEFFAQRDHTICKSDLLIPSNDPTLLFTPAGMNPFKEMFLGVGNLPFKRVTSSQKCMRMPDLENVGRTASHHTFFEMLGNFSFGDYFKKEAIAWSLEYLVGELGLSFDDLRISVYKDDDEAEEIWRRQMNVPADRIYRFGEDDNFWPAMAPSKGPNGVCGPCSEIYVDLKDGCGKPDCNPACDCGRYVEIWNLVFTQFNRKDGGVLEPLPFKNIDTGMGFERLLRVLDGVKTNFDTALFKPILDKISALSGREYGEDALTDVRMRRVADHIRAAVFGIADGAPPSNEKQGYVIRKVMRRAIMDGRNLGIQDLFLHQLAPSVIGIMDNAYPELAEQASRIEQVILLEEKRFAETYLQGSTKLNLLMEELEAKGEKVLPGSSAFLLYDTFGFPLDLAERMLKEQGLELDVKGFEAEMEKQRTRARKGSMHTGEVFHLGPLAAVQKETPPTIFLGYEQLSASCRILHIVTEAGLVDTVGEGDRASLVLDETPFYSEAGGQISDIGQIRSEEFTFVVDGGVMREGDLLVHAGFVREGAVTRGSGAVAEVDDENRRAIQRNHTATHLLHHALREVLGTHVAQAGSLVESSRLRFDFLHEQAMKPAEIVGVQARVRSWILANLPVEAEIMSLKQARHAGAMALFGEKYGDQVRVISIHGLGEQTSSLELCGGTHVGTTGEIGGFRILSEESIAAGTRRIEAATGQALNEIIDRKFDLVREACALLKVNETDLSQSINQLKEQIKEQRKALRKMRTAETDKVLETILDTGRILAGDLRLYSGRVDDIPIDELRKLADTIRAKSEGPAGSILISVEGERVHIVAAFDKDFQAKGIRAGDYCRKIGKALGGGGGGRPDMAQGQGKDTAQAPQALEQAVKEVEKAVEQA